MGRFIQDCYFFVEITEKLLIYSLFLYLKCGMGIYLNYEYKLTFQSGLRKKKRCIEEKNSGISVPCFFLAAQ